MRQSEKIAYAEGYHSGAIGEQFDNPYDDYELLTQYSYGYLTGKERLELFLNHYEEETE
jgi:hypothetical protein